MSTEEMRDLLLQTINQRNGLNASPIESPGSSSVIGIEDEEAGVLFFLDITEA
ncbi:MULTISPECIES: hypothetical protein [Streptomyces griseus group]|uniref:hypothetical protein n=1 Tax=Streptomyces griseus group TaxID=629295 RepID=UPI00131A1990|nr:hypothetical protein [Streptomyces baarnensis]